MKIKKRHVGEEFLYIGETLADFSLKKRDIVILLYHQRDIDGETLCEVTQKENYYNLRSFLVNPQYLLRIKNVTARKIFTGEMIKAMADKIVELHNHSGRVVFDDESEELSQGDTVYFIRSDPEECKYISFGEECDYIGLGGDPEKVIVRTNKGRYTTLALSKESISKIKPGFFDAHTAKAAKESIPLDQETADAIKAMVDKMVGKRLIDFGVGYANVATDENPVYLKRMVSSISIKVD